MKLVVQSKNVVQQFCSDEANHVLLGYLFIFHVKISNTKLSYFRSPSKEEKTEFKPIFNYLKKGHKLMVSLQAKNANDRSENTVSYPEKIVKFTLTKPMLSYAENPNQATDFCMPKQMLIENCDKATASIISYIIDQ